MAQSSASINTLRNTDAVCGRILFTPMLREFDRVPANDSYSCLLGRPTCLDPRFSDTRPPSNLDLPDLLQDKSAQPKDKDEPTFATYLILRKSLGEIVARVTEHFQLLDEQVQYRDVEAIDEEFKDFIADLPPAFRMLDPDRSWDDKLWYLPVHRYYIQTEILHFTIILHRPWLLRKLRSSRYALSRHACLEAAVTDFKIVSLTRGQANS